MYRQPQAPSLFQFLAIFVFNKILASFLVARAGALRRWRRHCISGLRGFGAMDAIIADRKEVVSKLGILEFRTA